MRRIGVFAAICLLAACQKQDGEGAAGSANADGTEWSSIGFNTEEQRHSPLTKINDGNVDELGIAWFKDLPDMRGQEATPIVVNGKIYISTAWSKVFAYDAKTGEELWNYDPEVPGEKAVDVCCDVVNRGVAISRGKLFFATIDGRLIALDAGTGARLWETQTTDKSKPYSITGAPRVVKDMVMIGNGGAEFGVRGYITAYHVSDGSQKWRFYTVPNPEGKPDGAASDEIFEKAAAKTWNDTGEWKESGGGGTVWDSIVYDEELDQLYFGVGNGNPWNHGIRSGGEGDNLFLSSIVAVKPETGEYIWHYQETPAESWDFTATQPMILAKQMVDGKETPVIYHAPKNGFFFTINRTNGKLIAAEPFVSPVTWATGYDLDTGRPIENPEARFYKTGKTFLSIPSAQGAHNWHPMSYNPKTGLIYIPAQSIPMGYLSPTEEVENRQKLGFNTGISLEAAVGIPDDKATYEAILSSTVGQLVAFDPIAGKAKWSVDYSAPWNGGTMTTAGNLVFQGTSTGLFKAYSADDGDELFSLDTQSTVMGGASTYEVDGVQYIAFLTGKGTSFGMNAGVAGKEFRKVANIPRLVVLKLGGTAKFPALPASMVLPWNPPEREGTAAQIKSGGTLFGRYCSVCHGGGAVGSGVTPDLRISAMLTSSEGWKSVVLDGLLKDNGMVSFAPVLSAAQAEQIRVYVIDRSNWTKENVPEMTKPMVR